jgi:2-polyprenyl-6-methoxyphenol hydroxylase-like FAD-dependent oxidoreductase
MNDPEPYDAVVIGGGKGGKTLAMYLARQNYKVALIERDPMMIGGGVRILAKNTHNVLLESLPPPPYS